MQTNDHERPVRLRIAFASSLLAAIALASPLAEAATVTLSGSGAMSPSFQFLSPNGSTPVVGDDYALAVPGQYTMTRQFLSSQATLAPLATSLVGAYTFMDSYRFTIEQAANGSTLVASLGLGSANDPLFNISNLQLRLYRVETSTTAPTIPGLPANSFVLTPWQGPNSGASTVTALFQAVQSGTYVLDVAGIANGSSGGTYVGQLNLQAVPLPAAGWLLLSGVGMLVGVRRRRAG